MSKILDPMLLEEMIQYNEDGNFDRIVAAELALAQAYKMAPIYGKASDKVDDRAASLLKKRKGKSLFPPTTTAFKNTNRKLFR